ncbi:MAG: hypothetical protein WBN92_05020, partial [Terriglobia bacterium]
MRPHSRYWLGLAFVISFLAVGISYWKIPYANLSLPHSLIGPGLLVVGFAAAAARAISRVRFFAVLIVVGASVPVAV